MEPLERPKVPASAARAERKLLRQASRNPKTGARRSSQPGGIRWLSSSDTLLDHADVVIIGGGTTGVGLLWDLTLRGFDVILLEQAGLGSGTSGAFHGLLHSGARYAGSESRTAAKCLAENRILKSIARPFISDTGGLFVRLPEDDASWEKTWLAGCRAAGLRPERVALGDLRQAEPNLSPDILAAYRVPDAAIDGFGLLWSLLWLSADAGARVFFRARVTGFLTDEAGVRGVRVVGLDGAEEAAEGRGPALEPGEIVASVVVNATGPWAKDTAALAGPTAAAAVPVERDKGSLLIFAERVVSSVVNRLRPPGDGDILVPHGPVTIAGTTSAPVARAGHQGPTPQEIKLILTQGRALLPALDAVPPLRAYAGLRPLLGSKDESAVGRGAGRDFLLVDHGRDGKLAGLVTVAGGKFTTFRAMAEQAGNLVAALLGKPAACRTAEVGIPRLRRQPDASGLSVTPEPAAKDGRAAPGAPERGLAGAFACECELVALPHLLSLLDSGLRLSDAGRLTRLGMGSCQGTFCANRLAGAMWQAGWPGTRRRPHPDEGAITAELAAFRRSRTAGLRAVEWGNQARLGVLAQALDQLTLGEADKAGKGATRR
jgi:glycerol-3-phosphate dehydrogenase